jgi:hypothetical protein
MLVIYLTSHFHCILHGNALLGRNDKTDACTFLVGMYPRQVPVSTYEPLVSPGRNSFCGFVSCVGINLLAKNSSCLQDCINTKQTLFSHHPCDKLCSKVMLRELWRKSCGCWHYLQLADPAIIGTETTNLRSLTKKVARTCVHIGIPVNIIDKSAAGK